ASASAAGGGGLSQDAGDVAAAGVHPCRSDAVVHRSRISRYDTDVGKHAAGGGKRRVARRRAVDASTRGRDIFRRAQRQSLRTRNRATPYTIRAMKRFAGIYTPISTPFRQDDTIDEPALRSNVAKWMSTSLTGLVVLGSNGEAAQLDDDEADRVVAIVREGVPKGRPLIAGTGRESTKATIAATHRAAAAGVDAALVRTPSFFKPQMTSDAFVRHYTDVAEASPIPVLLYNVTLYTGVHLLPDAVERLAV